MSAIANAWANKSVIHNTMLIMAGQSATITYGKLFEPYKLNLGYDPHLFAATGILDEINEDERNAHNLYHPLLSSVVINQEKKMPGPGFFTLAEKWGKLPKNASGKKKKTFWKSERDRVYAHYGQTQQP